MQPMEKRVKTIFPLSFLVGGNKLEKGDISIRWIVSAGPLFLHGQRANLVWWNIPKIKNNDVFVSELLM